MHNPKVSRDWHGEFIMRNELHVPQHNIQGNSQFDTIFHPNFISYHKPQESHKHRVREKGSGSHRPGPKS